MTAVGLWLRRSLLMPALGLLVGQLVELTTVAAAAILFTFGTGPIRGFAVTLTIGLIANLFTSVYVSRTIFDYILSRRQKGEALSV